MNLQELNAYAIAGKVDELNLISMEGGIYLLGGADAWGGVSVERCATAR